MPSISRFFGAAGMRPARRGLLGALLGAVLAAAPAAGQARSATPSSAADERALRALEQDWATAVERHDLAALDTILAPEFVITSPTGRVADKSAYLGYRAGDNAKADSLVGSETRVRLFGGSAVVTTLSVTSVARRRSGRVRQLTVRSTDTWVRRRGRWQCVASHLSLVLPSPRP
jgi:ketosteroid isomerase-like protein